MVRDGDDNVELKYSLRSVALFAPKFDKIWIIGYKPDWVTNVEFIPTVQFQAKKYTATNNNLRVACESVYISNDFVLMNDDFILTRPISSWEDSLNFIRNKLKDQIKIYHSSCETDYTQAFDYNLPMIQEISGNPDPDDYELHIPIIINKNKFLDVFNDKRVIKHMKEHKITLKRSLYGNVNHKFTRITPDVKIRGGDPETIDSEWVSVLDNFIGKSHPRFTAYLDRLFSNKCRYEV